MKTITLINSIYLGKLHIQKVLVFLSTHNKYLLFRDSIIGEDFVLQKPKSKVHVIIFILKCK